MRTDRIAGLSAHLSDAISQQSLVRTVRLSFAIDSNSSLATR